MSVIVAKSGASAPGGGSGPTLELYDENPLSPTPPAAEGENSVALGMGAQTATGANNSIAIGNQSLARHQGAQVFANGRFSTTGDVQAGKYLLRTITTTHVSQEVFLDGVGGSQRLTLPDDSTWTFTITATGHRTDASDGHAGYKFQGVIYRRSGPSTIAFQGIPVKDILSESNTEWDINITADTSTGSLRIVVTGQSAKIIRWGVLVETVEVTN